MIGNVIGINGTKTAIMMDLYAQVDVSHVLMQQMVPNVITNDILSDNPAVNYKERDSSYQEIEEHGNKLNEFKQSQQNTIIGLSFSCECHAWY